MKVIIAYASAGSGHLKAAEAVYNFLRQKDKELKIELIDVLQESNLFFSNIYAYGYKFLISYTPYLWSLGFYITQVKPLRRLTKTINFIINRLNTQRFAQDLIREEPDFVICTHFLPSEICAYLKRAKKIKSKLVTVITDFGVHPFWIDKAVDIYVVASDITREKLVLEGINKERIRESGIPVDLKFLRTYKKEGLCKKFDIDQNKFTILIVTGSFGIGPIEEIVDLLHEDVQILVVCAKNKRLFIRLKNKNYHSVRIFGFIDNIQELMAVSDIIVTKPGGLTISEVLAMELVPIFISAIPGQETENAKIVERYGIGLEAKNAKDVKNIVFDYKANPDRLNRIKDNIRKIKKPDALEEIYNAICAGSIGPAN